MIYSPNGENIHMEKPKDKIENIGNRISVFQNEEVTSFVIIPTDAGWKVWLLFLWLFLWTISGVLVIINYFHLSDTNVKLVVIVWLAFWAYFEFRLGRAYLFRKFGKEKIWVKRGTLFYWKDIAGAGKKQEFDKTMVSEIGLVEKKKNDFFQFMNESFWVVGGQSLFLQYGAKTITFGIQLNDSDCRELQKRLKNALKDQL